MRRTGGIGESDGSSMSTRIGSARPEIAQVSIASANRVDGLLQRESIEDGPNRGVCGRASKRMVSPLRRLHRPPYEQPRPCSFKESAAQALSAKPSGDRGLQRLQQWVFAG